METKSQRAHRLAFRANFAATGNETLRALLLVSGGGTVAYLAFLNGALGKELALGNVPPEVAAQFLAAMWRYIWSVVLCVGCYGFTWLSHGSYYFRFELWGRVFMVIAAVVGIASMSLFACGSMCAIGALRSAVQELGQRQNAPK